MMKALFCTNGFLALFVLNHFSQPAFSSFVLPSISISFTSTSRDHLPSNNDPRTSSLSTSLSMGGYDATVGIDPNVPIQFFTTPGNTCPYAARTYIVLEELNLSFDLTEVSGYPTKPDWYMKNINPKGKVPAIRIPSLDNFVVYESGICCEFLCEYFSEAMFGLSTTLIPNDAMGKAQMRLLNDHLDNEFSKTQFTYLMNKEDDNGERTDSKLSSIMENALVVFEESLEQNCHDGPYLLGKHFTLADVHLIPFVQRLIVSLNHFKQYQLPSDKFPKLLAWFDLCSQRESVRGATLTDDQIIEIYSKFMDINYRFGGLNTN
jgi:glutathione S-transferase